MDTSLRRRLGIATAALALGLSGPAASARAAAPETVATAAVTTSAPSAAEAATSSLPCGFSFWHQSYRNCSSTNVRLAVSAHESISGRWFTYYYCLPPGGSRQPLAIVYQLAFAVYANATSRSC